MSELSSSPVSTSTTCPYCGVGCGVKVEQGIDGAVTVSPDQKHPANLGRLCSKGMALGDTLDNPQRLLYPEIEGEQVSWDTASSEVAQRFNSIIKEHGPEAVAFYVSGQLLTEDYYVANKLMKGFIGSANIDTNSRLCMSSAVVAHKRAFGEDLVPCSYEDLEQTDLIVLIGSNTAWCHPVLYQRMVAAKKENPALRVVLIDPRETQTADLADLHLPLKPGSDAFLFNGLLAYLADNGHTAAAFVEQHTENSVGAINEAKTSAKDVVAVAEQCDLSVEAVSAFYALFASTDKVVSVFSQGVNQSSSGSDKGNALINCHLLTGKIGKPGMGPFSFTGQPNAMGGREVGGLANMLAAHMEIENPESRQLVQDFWQSPTIAPKQGLKAVDLFEAVHSGKIKAVWIMATNPAVSLPNTNRVREALDLCENVIVSDCVSNTDTLKYANIRLPALTWGERNGTVTNSERTISRQRPFLAAPGEAKPDWQIITEVARKMGHAEQFQYDISLDVFREHAALSGYKNEGERCFDISPLADLSVDEFDAMQPFQWPLKENADGSLVGTQRLFEDGKFFTPNGKARFISVSAEMPATQTSDEYSLILNTGRVRDHWHTMTRTGTSARLSSHVSQPTVEINPDDADMRGVKEGDLLRVHNEYGELCLPAKFDKGLRKGNVFVPIHWTKQFSGSSVVSDVMPPVVDPVSGQPESKFSAVEVEAVDTVWHGFLISRRQLNLDMASFWHCQKVEGAWYYSLAGEQLPENWAEMSRELLCQSDDKGDWAEYFDKSRQIYRGARFVNNRLESCVFVSQTAKQLPATNWLKQLFTQESLNKEERQSLLSGKPSTPMEDTGKVVCSCFNIGEKTIKEAIQAQKLCSVEDIGKCLKAGTNCGSCIPELKGFL
jgi:assimilatory nitrate reductase catalytic subunit